MTITSINNNYLKKKKKKYYEKKYKIKILINKNKSLFITNNFFF